MVQVCCVPRCRRSFRKDLDISYHQIPTDKTRRMQWLTSLNMMSPKYMEQSKHMRVCSNHFLPNDYIIGGNVKRLKKSAIPKLHLPNDTDSVSPKSPMKEQPEEKKFFNVQYIHLGPRTINGQIQMLKYGIKSPELEMNTLQKENEIFTFHTLKDNDHKTFRLTGFQKYKVMVAIFEFILSGNVNDLHLHLKSETVVKHTYSVNLEQQFLLTMLRLRHAYNEKTLSTIFNVPPATAIKIFHYWTRLMYLRFSHLNIWPHRNVIIANAPQHCQQNYKNVIGSIDSVEFYIEKPKDLKKKKQYYSEFKKRATVKSLLMADPSGTIIYMSPLQIGSIDNESLVKKSGFLNVLKRKLESGEIQQNDVILADKSFKLHMLTDINIQTQASKSQNGNPRGVEAVAHERMQVERAISILKEYKYLRKKIRTDMLNSAHQIYVICCVLCLFRNKLRT